MNFYSRGFNISVAEPVFSLKERLVSVPLDLTINNVVTSLTNKTSSCCPDYGPAFAISTGKL